jgi:hypothetical protein
MVLQSAQVCISHFFADTSSSFSVLLIHISFIVTSTCYPATANPSKDAEDGSAWVPIGLPIQGKQFGNIL